MDQTTVDINAGEYGFRLDLGSVVELAGFTKVYEEGKDEDAAVAADAAATNGVAKKGRVRLPELNEKDPLDCSKLEPKQHFTEPPPRFTEATLVKALEENGIGRPSTYSTIVDTIQARGYVTQEERRFKPTDIGIAVNDLLAEHFKDIVDLKFTAGMEGSLDKVAVGTADWVETSAECRRPVYGRARGSARRSSRALRSRMSQWMKSARIANDRWSLQHRLRFWRFHLRCTGQSCVRNERNRSSKTPVQRLADGGMACGVDASKKGRTFFGCAQPFEFLRLRLMGSRDCRAVPDAQQLRGSRRPARGATVSECAADMEHDVSAIAKAKGDASGRTRTRGEYSCTCSC